MNWRTSNNLARGSPAVSSKTWRKISLHLHLFLTYAQDEKEVEPTMKLVENQEMDESFLTRIQRQRRLQPTTMGTYTGHCCSELKFICSCTENNYKHPMYTMLSLKAKDFCRQVHSTAHDSWQSLAQKKQWLDWYVVCVCLHVCIYVCVCMYATMHACMHVHVCMLHV